MCISTYKKLPTGSTSVARGRPALSNLDMEQIDKSLLRTILSEEKSSNENNPPNNKATKEGRSDYAYQQIVGFLQDEKLSHFNTLRTPSERVQFIFKNKAFKPLLEVSIFFRELLI